MTPCGISNDNWICGLPQVQNPARISRREYEKRWQNHRLTNSATDEGFLENQVAEPATSGVWVDGIKRTNKKEANMNAGVLVLVNGSIEGIDLGVIADNPKISTIERQNLRDQHIHNLSSATKSKFLGQFVRGKVEVHDMLVALSHRERKALELGIIPAHGTVEQRNARVQLRQELMANLVTERARLVTHLNTVIDDIETGDRDAYWPAPHGRPGTRGSKALTTRAIHYVEGIRDRVSQPLLADMQVLTVQQLPPREHYYHCKTAESRKIFWYRHFDDNVFQVFISIGRIVEIASTQANEGMRSFMKYRIATMADAAYLNHVGPVAEVDRMSRLLDNFNLRAAYNFEG